MARSRTKLASPFTGLWHIVSMDAWEEDYLNEEVQAYIEFEAKGAGNFQFGYITGYMDWRPSARDGKPAVEWTWEGGDGADGTPLTGRGWGALEEEELRGIIAIHMGEESGFVAKKPKASKPKLKKRPGKK